MHKTVHVEQQERYEHEPGEPPHVHVDQDRRSAKFWLETVRLARNIGFPVHEIQRIRCIIEDNQSELLDVNATVNPQLFAAE